MSYNKLWKLVKAREYSTYTLREKYNLSSGTVRRLQNNQTITTDTLEKLCKIFDCNVEDIIEYIPDKN